MNTRNIVIGMCAWFACMSLLWAQTSKSPTETQTQFSRSLHSYRVLKISSDDRRECVLVPNFEELVKKTENFGVLATNQADREIEGKELAQYEIYTSGICPHCNTAISLLNISEADLEKGIRQGGVACPSDMCKKTRTSENPKKIPAEELCKEVVYGLHGIGLVDKNKDQNISIEELTGNPDTPEDDYITLKDWRKKNLPEVRFLYLDKKEPYCFLTKEELEADRREFYFPTDDAKDVLKMVQEEWKKAESEKNKDKKKKIEQTIAELENKIKREEKDREECLRCGLYVEVIQCNCGKALRTSGVEYEDGKVRCPDCNRWTSTREATYTPSPAFEQKDLNGDRRLSEEELSDVVTLKDWEKYYLTEKLFYQLDQKEPFGMITREEFNEDPYQGEAQGNKQDKSLIARRCSAIPKYEEKLKVLKEKGYPGLSEAEYIIDKKATIAPHDLCEFSGEEPWTRYYVEVKEGEEDDERQAVRKVDLGSYNFLLLQDLEQSNVSTSYICFAIVVALVVVVTMGVSLFTKRS